ncbi:MAG TPA: hypothetical protein VNT56_06900 [Acidimicrobiales bacterium]|nr:hypothetical protein [Acidimicrobiales bacterium]
MSIRELLRTRTTERTPPTKRRDGVVQSVTAPTCTVRLDGSTVDIPGVPYVAGLSLAVNDVVEVTLIGRRPRVTAKLA